jgi:hypothetical protein
MPTDHQPLNLIRSFEDLHDLEIRRSTCVMSWDDTAAAAEAKSRSHVLSMARAGAWTARAGVLSAAPGLSQAPDVVDLDSRRRWYA